MKLLVGTVPVEVEVRGSEVQVALGGETFLLSCARDPQRGLIVGGARVWVEGGRAGLAGDSATVHRVGTGVSAALPALTPPMPATVLRVEVTVGDVVRAGQALLVLGAMKTEIVLRAPVPSAVRAIHTRVGSAVVPGERLVDLDPLDPKA